MKMQMCYYRQRMMQEINNEKKCRERTSYEESKSEIEILLAQVVRQYE